MEDITFAMALVLGLGFAAAKLAGLLRLPAVTGYICAGLALGPSGLGLISRETIEGRLGHFTQIALMLIAFGIGEHLEYKKLRHTFRNVGLIGMCEGILSFLLVAIGTFLVIMATVKGEPILTIIDGMAVALLLGAIAVATAPASTLHVMREIRASGPVSTTLLHIVAINNGMAVMVFGVMVSVVSHLLTEPTGTLLAPMVASVLASIGEIGGSLLMGVVTGLLLDFLVNRLRQRSEMLVVGLSLLLLCGELARMLHYSPLLAGMATGFTIVNRSQRDVRLFRVLNTFEPPLLVLFFALAGAHIEFSSLFTAGWLGISYFIFRAAGKFLGANLGARLAATTDSVRRAIGLALFPQAGIAIGLVFLISEYPGLSRFSSLITTVVLTGVFLSELAGPVCTKYALEKSGEAEGLSDLQPPNHQRIHPRDICPVPHSGEDLQLIPWTWERLRADHRPEGAVIFGLSHAKTVGGLTRMATILAHHYHAMPVAVNVLPAGPSADHIARIEATQGLFRSAMDESFSLGYWLETATTHAATVSAGLLETASLNKTRAILLGHALTDTNQDFQKVVEHVAAEAPCPVLVVKFTGVLHTERILVPLTSIRELNVLQDMIIALSTVGQHKITLLYLLPPESSEAEREKNRQRLAAWIGKAGITSEVVCRAESTESRLETIVTEAAFHDLLIMDAKVAHGLKRLLLGSLAESVARQSGRTTILIHAPGR
ncbi:MAG: cation:proton antiporter [Proteobacteria bacterium]|nr:cation:proton antiporter [Pseudomonadota bacterium]MBU1687586.1 cation:proton antiporter [Pseudomonadota bacterium]